MPQVPACPAGRPRPSRCPSGRRMAKRLAERGERGIWSKGSSVSPIGSPGRPGPVSRNRARERAVREGEGMERGWRERGLGGPRGSPTRWSVVFRRWSEGHLGRSCPGYIGPVQRNTRQGRGGRSVSSALHTYVCIRTIRLTNSRVALHSLSWAYFPRSS